MKKLYRVELIMGDPADRKNHIIFEYESKARCMGQYFALLQKNAGKEYGREYTVELSEREYETENAGIF